MRKLILSKAKKLRHGDIVHLTGYFNADGSCQRWRVSGKVKTWKRDKNRLQIPIKHGLYNHAYINEDIVGQFHLECNCTNAKQ